ncbi:hypothetical protein [Methanoculleus sp. UBA312]
MTPDQKGKYDAPLYGDPDLRGCLRAFAVLAAICGSFIMGVIVGRCP